MKREDLKEALRSHLSTLISFEDAGYPIGKEDTLKEVASSLYNEVIKGNPSELHKGLCEAFKSAIQGLPSYINQPFAYYDISNLMYSLGWEFNRNDDDEYFAACELYSDLLGEILAKEFTAIETINI